MSYYMLHLRRLELCQYSSQTFSITSEEVSTPWWNQGQRRFDTKTHYRLSVQDDITKQVVETVEVQSDEHYLRHEFERLKDKYIFDYQHVLQSSKDSFQPAY